MEAKKKMGIILNEFQPDVILPVPVHKKRLRFRGFNQAEVLAEGLGDYLNIPVDGSGDGKFFTNGKMIEGYWSNPGELGTPARYFDNNNKEITLNTGKTFICIVWNDYKDDVVIK